MTDSTLLTGHDLTLPLFGIDGLPEHITKLSISVEANELVLINCEFYATEAQGKQIKANFETLQSQYVLIDRAELESLRKAVA